MNSINVNLSGQPSIQASSVFYGKMNTDRLTNGTQNVILGSDGSLTFTNKPTNARTGTANALLFNKDSNQKVVGTQGGTQSNPTVERLVITGGDGFNAGEGGDIYLWAGRSGAIGGSGGDIKVDAGDGYNGGGGTIKIRGGNVQNTSEPNIANGGFIEVTAGSSWNGGDGANLTLTAGNSYNGGSDGNVIVTTGKGTHSWNFNADGSLTFPDGSVQNTAMTTSSVLDVIGDGSVIDQQYFPNELQVTGLELTDTSAVVLPTNTLGCNSIGNLVMHDGLTMGGQVITDKNTRYVNNVSLISVEQQNANGGYNEFEFGRIKLLASECNANSVIRVQGTIRGRFNSGAYITLEIKPEFSLGVPAGIGCLLVDTIGEYPTYNLDVLLPLYDNGDGALAMGYQSIGSTIQVALGENYSPVTTTRWLGGTVDTQPTIADNSSIIIPDIEQDLAFKFYIFSPDNAANTLIYAYSDLKINVYHL